MCSAVAVTILASGALDLMTSITGAAVPKDPGLTLRSYTCFGRDRYPLCDEGLLPGNAEAFSVL